jgi:Type-IV b secretion system, inner-membrane complex component
MSIKPVELLTIRNEFYAQTFAQIKVLLTALIIILALLVGFMWYQNRSIFLAPKYFPTTPDGRLIISPPFNENHLLLSKQEVTPSGVIIGMPPPIKSYYELEPLGDNALVIYWAKLAVEQIFAFDYVHFRSVIESGRKYFTAEGHANFIKALLDSKNLDPLQARSAVVIPTITGEIKILKTYLAAEHFAWDLEIPFRLTYESTMDTEPLVLDLMAKMSIGRVTTLRLPFYGISIFKLNFEQVFNSEKT